MSSETGSSTEKTTFDEMVALREQLLGADSAVTETMARMHYATQLRSMQSGILSVTRDAMNHVAAVSSVPSAVQAFAPAFAILQVLSAHVGIMQDIAAPRAQQIQETLPLRKTGS